MNTINVENCKTLLIGRRGENEVTTVAFDFTEWASEFGSGVVDLYVKRFGDESAYPVVLTIDGTVASWLVTETDTNVAGYGKAEYVYRVDGKIAKSAVFPFFVAEDIGQPASEPPDPYESWLEQLTALGAETEAHAQAAEQSAENAADSAEDAAQSATSAEGYAGQAETAAWLAQAAQTASEAARDAAQTAQASAEASATAASGSAASAAGSATSAAGSASDASASATAAGASATSAGNAATQAETAKTAAQTAQSAAEDAAEDAQQAAQQAHVEYEQLSGEVDDLSDEVSQQKSAIEDLQALTNRKAGMLVDSVSGAVASFVPDASVDNLLGVTVDVEPVQDLHGYDSPWPAGGGVNQFDQDTVLPSIGFVRDGDAWFVQYSSTPRDQIVWENTSEISGSVALTYTYKYSSTSSQGVRFRFEYTDGTATDNYAAGIDGYYTRSFTSDAAKTLARIMTTYGTGSVSTWFKDVQVNFGAAIPYAPYKNICPISGWDAVEVVADGVNLLPNDYDVYNIGNAYIYLSGVIKNGETAQFVLIDKDTSVDISDCGIGFQTGLSQSQGLPTAFRWAINNGVVQSNKSNVSARGVACDGVMIYPKTVETFNKLFSRFDIMVVLDSTATTEYKPYAGNRYTIQLGQTVYGGALDVGAGTMTVDRAMLTLDGTQTELAGVNWRPQANSVGFYYTFSGLNIKIPPAITVATEAIADSAKAVSYDAIFSNDICSFAVSTVSGADFTPRIFVRLTDTTLTTKAAVNAYLVQHPITICYPLATPITITLDPVTISTISGQTNNVWADAGDVDVEYAADIKAYIDRLNQPTEDDMIANTLIQSGKYFTINNRLFLSTASIAAGAQIIPGTNCQETSLAAALNALNA